jgi:hypothetical protein
MKVELPREGKRLGNIKAGDCFAFTRGQVTSIAMKVDWLGSNSVAVLWSGSDDWTVPCLIAATELAGSSLHSLPSAVFVACSDARHIRAGATRHEHAPGFLIKTPDGQMLIAVSGLQPEHGRAVIDLDTGRASGIESDDLTFFTSWRIVTKVLDRHETVCSFPSHQKSTGSPMLVVDKTFASAEGTTVPRTKPSRPSLIEAVGLETRRANG